MVLVKYCKYVFFEAKELRVGVTFCFKLPVLLLPYSISAVPDVFGDKQFRAICIPSLHIELGTDGLTVPLHLKSHFEALDGLTDPMNTSDILHVHQSAQKNERRSHRSATLINPIILDMAVDDLLKRPNCGRVRSLRR
jgi:hypothetical protein